MRCQYEWPRYWKPIGRKRFTATEEDSLAAAPDGLTLEQVSYIRCLALLGEPGSGKSCAIEKEVDRLKTTNVVARYRNLEAYDTSEILIKRVFEDAIYKEWLVGDHALYLFLDSLDKTRIPQNVVTNLIVDELRDAPIERLYLRIGCRAAHWPLYLQEELIARWQELSKDRSKQEDYYATLQINPLNATEIAIAAVDNEIDLTNFLSASDSAGVVPLASIPINLEFLISKYKDGGLVATNRKELYATGLRQHLVDMTRGEAFNSRKRLEDRLNIASAIAFAMIFTNHYSLFVGTNPIDLLPEDLELSDFLDANPDLDEAIVRDVLQSSLFTNLDHARLIWYHQTHAEFLAANYLVMRRTSDHNVRRLLVSNNGLVAPQLLDIVGWLVEMRASLLNSIAKSASQIILHTDLAALPINTLKGLFEKLYAQSEDYLFAYLRIQLREGSIRLNHPNLAQVIRQFLNGNYKGVYFRQFLVMLVEQYKVTGLDDVLINIVLARDEDLLLRQFAADALYEIGSTVSKQKMKPLIFGMREDKDDELKGYALLSLWPEHITAKELFNALQPPKRSSYFGAYSLFLIRMNLKDTLAIRDLPTALAWVAQQPAFHKISLRLRDLIDTIVILAWYGLDDTEVFDSYIETISMRLLKGDEIIDHHVWSIRGESEIGAQFKIDFQRDDARRRKLVYGLVRYFAQHNFDGRYLLTSSLPFVKNTDLGWLIERLQNSVSQEEKIWTLLIWRAFDRNDYQQIDLVYEATTKSAALLDQFKQFFGPTSLTIRSPRADSVKRESRIRARRLKPRRSAPGITIPNATPPLIERIDVCLAQIELGEVRKWEQLVFGLLVEDENGYSDFPHDFNPDLTTFPGWSVMGDVEKTRTRACAKLFIEKGTVAQTTWLHKEEFYISDISGYIALFLIEKFEPTWLESQRPEVFEKWGQVVLWYPFQFSEEITQIQNSLTQKIYEKDPAGIVRYIPVLLSSNGAYKANKLDRLWDDLLAETYIKELKLATINNEDFNRLLSQAVDHNDPYAIEIALQWIHIKATNDDDRMRQAFASIALLHHDAGRYWADIWSLMTNDSVIRNNIIETLMDVDHRHNEIGEKLNDLQLADLFILLEQVYPHTTDPIIEGGHFVSTRERIGTWRDSLLRHLQNRGTSSSAQQVQRIAAEFPKYEWLQIMKHEAIITTSQSEWNPPSLQEAFRLAQPRKTITSVVKAHPRIASAIVTLISALFVALYTIFQPDIRLLLLRTFSPSSLEAEITPTVSYFTRTEALDAAITPEVSTESPPLSGLEITPTSGQYTNPISERMSALTNRPVRIP